MAQDKFYSQIFDALGGELDPKTFEACACDLIRADVPGLTPIPGGNDGGKDGAIPDLEGEAYPLVCTTGEDVIGNLTGSLQSYLDRGGTRRKVISATSQSLTAKRRENLEQRAREMGFTMVNVYERQALAERLYRNSRWCRELLGLTGEPSVLSKIPPNPRTDYVEKLVGRDSDLKWINEQSSDAVVSGQPGAGKTFLLRSVVDAEDAYFLTDSNKEKIASALRDLSPKLIIVDDAHVQIDALRALMQIRREVQGSFRIIAVTWPNSVTDLKLELSISDKSCRELRLLKRDEIVEVIKAASITGPDQVIREIVNQAEGKPGLAALLSHLCVAGDIRKFWTGDLLFDWVLHSLTKISGDRHVEVIASFALGGPGGVNLETVSKFLNFPAAQVRRITADLDAAGIVSEVGDKIAVTPPTLRFALVREVFFKGAASLKAQPLLAEIDNFSDAVATILGAAHRGANIREDQLVALVSSADDDDCWQSFAWIGRRETMIVMDRFQDKSLKIIDPALHYCPEKILPLLFEEGTKDNRPLNSATDHPFRKISDWISHSRPDIGEVGRKRKALLGQILKSICEGKHSEAAYQLLPNVFEIGFEENALDPGAGRTFHMRFGIYGPEELRELFSLWSQCFETIKGDVSAKLSDVIKAVEEVVYYGRHRVQPHPEAKDVLDELSKTMVANVASLCVSKPAAASRIQQIADDIGLTIDIPDDENFSILFPTRAEFRAASDFDERLKPVRNLADQWKSWTPVAVATELNRVEKEAQEINLTWPRLTVNLAEMIASYAQDPVIWIEEFVRNDVKPDLIAPFFAQAIKLNSPGWEAIFHREFNGRLRYFLFNQILSHPKPPQMLLELALEASEEFADTVEFMIVHVPEQTLKSLLTHPCSKVRGHAAVGMWHGEKRGKELISSHRTLWEDAIVSFSDEEYWLTEIFSSNSDLSFRWAVKRFENISEIGFKNEQLLKSLCRQFNSEQRRQLIQALKPSSRASEFLLPLIRGDKELCTEFIKVDRWKRWHLDLAEWFVSREEWEVRVRILLAASYSHDEIGENVLPGRYMWSGNESDMWKGWLETFSDLAKDADKDIALIGKRAYDTAKERFDRSLKWEEQEAIYGRDR